MGGLRLGLGVYTGNTSKVYDPDAAAYFNSIGDIPAHQKNAINKRIKAFKANGTWSNLQFWFPAPSTEVWDEFTREIKSNTKAGTIRVGNPVADVAAETEYHPRIVASGSGFAMTTVDSDVGIVKTNFTPSGFMTLNNSCWGIICQDQTSALAGFNGGAFNSSSQSMIFQKRDATNNLYSDAYNTTVSGGRARQTSSSGAGGNFMFNRRSSSDFIIYRNGTSIATSSSSGGTLPTANFIINGYLNNTASSTNVRNETIGSIYAYNTSLTPAQIAQENTDWQTFMTDMKRTGTYSKSIIWCGNSQSVMFYGSWFRRLMYNYSTNEWFIRNVSKHGRTTVQMNTNRTTEIFPFLNASNGTNYVFLWEGTNDISSGSNGATAWSNYRTLADNIRTYCTTNSIPVHIVAVPSMARRFDGNDAAILATDVFNQNVRDNYALSFDGTTGAFGSNLWIWRSNYASDAAYITAVRTLCNNTTYYDSGGTHLQKSAYLSECYPIFKNYIDSH